MKGRRSARVAVAVCAMAATWLLTTAAASALGGPVIIGGDDLTDHGCIDVAGDPIQGWLYLERALENVSPNVTRANDGSVAALGSDPGDADDCGNAGSAIGVAAAEAGLSVTYYEGPDAIDEFFTALADGMASPRIIWIAGTGASNDLDSDERDALAANATAIGDFVNAGGGLVSHGSAYEWLFGLLPGLASVDNGSSDDLYLTPEGAAAFPGVTESDVNAGPWHNFFEGDFGGLQVLVRSGDIDDSQGSDAAVILGGAAVVLPGTITLDPPHAINAPGTSHTVVATVRYPNGEPRPEEFVTFEVISGPNAGASGEAYTNSEGQASFTYTSNGLTGLDTIQASFFDQVIESLSFHGKSQGEEHVATATKLWALPGSDTPPADIGVVKTDRPDPVNVGDLLTYTNVVTNWGPGQAPGSTFGDTLPASVTLVSVSTTKGTCSGTTRVECSFGTLDVNEQVTVTIVVRTNEPGTVTNTAEVGTTVADWNVGNNQRSTAVTTVQGAFQPPSTCSLGVTARQVTAGIPTVLRVTATRDGSPASGVRIVVTGAGIDQQEEPTSAAGTARFTVQPTQSGRITIRGIGCGASIPVSAIRTSSCAAVRVTPTGAIVGQPTRVVVSARIRGRIAAGVRVTVTGQGVSASAITNRAGVARLRITPRSPGMLRVRLPGVLTCSRAFGVAGEFGPPGVTG